MKSTKILMMAAAIGLGLATLTASADEARDFSRYTNEELVQMRGQMHIASAAERKQFRAEMQQRARALSPEERAEQGFGLGNRRRAGQSEPGHRGPGRAEREPRLERQSGDFGRGYESRNRQGRRDGSGPECNR